MGKAFCAVLFLVFCPFVVAQQPLTNDSIIKMFKAGLSGDVIVTTINAAPGAYDTTPDGLIALKRAGVSDKVIAAIAVKGSASVSGPTAPSTSDTSGPTAPFPPGVDNVGVYYKDVSGNWQPLPSEVVIFESGGFIKHVASAGFMKQDLNGLVGGMRSRLVVSTPVTFLLHVPQGRTASDYELVHLHVAGNNRQFQSVAGGLNQTSGSIRDEIDFTATEIGASGYQIVLNNGLGDGEFGFLEPQDGSAPKTQASSGKIFTFAIVN